MNRKQRRAAARRGELSPPEETEGTSLKEYLDEPNQVVRRAEMWQVIQKAIALHEVQKRYNRWYNRLLRRIRGFFNRHFFLEEVGGAEPEMPDPEKPDDWEEPDEDHD